MSHALTRAMKTYTEMKYRSVVEDIPVYTCANNRANHQL